MAILNTKVDILHIDEFKALLELLAQEKETLPLKVIESLDKFEIKDIEKSVVKKGISTCSFDHEGSVFIDDIKLTDKIRGIKVNGLIDKSIEIERIVIGENGCPVVEDDDVKTVIDIYRFKRNL